MGTDLEDKHPIVRQPPPVKSSLVSGYQYLWGEEKGCFSMPREFWEI